VVRDKEKLIRQLEDMGLNEYESKVYLALVEGGVMSAPQASKLARIPIQRVYDILERLVEKGLVYILPGKVKRFGPAAPQTGMESFLQKERSRMENLLKEREKVAETLSRELSYLYNPTTQDDDFLDYIKIAKDPSYVGLIFSEAQNKAKERVWAFMRPPYSVPPDENVETQLAASKRGVQYRGIYEISTVDDTFKFFIKLGMAAGEEVRFTDHVPLKAAIFDNKLVFFALQDPLRSSYTYFFIDHEDIAVALSDTFNHIWERSRIPEEVLGSGVWDEVKKLREGLESKGD